jgi:hypothetical protein
VVDTSDEELKGLENTVEQSLEGPETASRRGARIRRQPDRYDTAYAISVGLTGPEQPKIPKIKAEALADPLWKAAI